MRSLDDVLNELEVDGFDLQTPQQVLRGQIAAPGAPALAGAPRGVDPGAAQKWAIDIESQMRTESAKTQAPAGLDDVDSLINEAAAGLRQPVAGETKWSDYGKSAVASLGSLGGMAAGAGEYAARALGSGGGEGGQFWRTLVPELEGLREGSNQFAQDWLAKRTPEAQARAQREFLNLDPDQTIWQGGVGEFISSIGLKTAESLAPTLVPLGGYALMARLGMGTAAATLWGVSEGTLSAGAIAGQAAEEVKEAPLDILMQSPVFQKRMQEAKGNEASARQAFITDVQGWAPLLAGATVGLIAKGAGTYLNKFFDPEKGAGFFTRVGKGAVVEGAFEEAPQSAVEQVATNVARRVYNSEAGVWDGVLESALQGAAVGGPMGGAVAGALGRRPQALTISADPISEDIAAAVNPVPVGPARVPKMGPFQAIPTQLDMFGGGGPDTQPQQLDLPLEPQESPPQGEQLGLFDRGEQGDLFGGFTGQPPGPPPPGGSPAAPPELDTGGLELAPGLGLREAPPAPNEGPQLPPDVVPYTEAEPTAPVEQPPFQVPGEDVVPYSRDVGNVEGRPRGPSTKETTGFRVRHFSPEGKLLGSKLVETEAAAEAVAAPLIAKLDKQTGKRGHVEIVPAKRTLPGDKVPSAEPVNDILAQAEDLQQSDRRAVYLSKPNLANLKAAGVLDKVLKSGVAINNFDSLGGVLIAKDPETANELIGLRDGEVGSLEEILGYATGAGVRKPAGAQQVIQKYTPAGDVVRERLISPGEADAVMREWGGDTKSFRVVPLQWAIQRRKELVKQEAKSRAKQPADKDEAKAKVAALYTGPLAESRPDAEELVEQDDVSEEEIGEKLITYAAETRQEEEGRRKFADVPAPEDVGFRNREIIAAQRKADEAKRGKDKLVSEKGDLLATPVETTKAGKPRVKAVKEREGQVAALDDGITRVNRDLQVAAGQASGNVEPGQKANAEYRNLYNALLDSAIRLEMQKDVGSKQDVIDAQAAYDAALVDIKRFIQVEGGYTKSQARMEAAMKFSRKAAKNVYARTKQAEKRGSDLDKAAEQGLRDKPQEPVSDEQSDKEVRTAGKVRNATEGVVGAEQSAEQSALASQTSVAAAAAMSRRVKNRRTRAASKIAENFSKWLDPAYQREAGDDATALFEINLLLRQWLSAYRHAIRSNTRDSRTKGPWKAREAFAGRLAEMIGNMRSENVPLNVAKDAARYIGERLTDVVLYANRFGVGGEVDVDGFVKAADKGPKALAQFLKNTIQSQEITGLPDLTEAQVSALTPGQLNSLYVRAVEKLTGERNSDTTRAAMVAGIRKFLGRKFKRGEKNEVRLAGPYKIYDSKGNVVDIKNEDRFVTSYELFSELLSGGKSSFGTKGDKRMPIEQVRLLYAQAVEESRKPGVPAKEWLPEKPEPKPLNQLALRVPASEKKQTILRAIAKQSADRVGGKSSAGGLTRTTVEKKGVPRADTRYTPSVLLSNAAPRELGEKEQAKYDAERTDAATQLTNALGVAANLLDRVQGADYQRIADQRNEDDSLTSTALNMVYGRAYLSWLYGYARSLDKLGPKSRAAISESLRVAEDIRKVASLSPDQFAEQMGAVFRAEMEEQANRVSFVSTKLQDLRNPEARAESLVQQNEEVLAQVMRSVRLNKIWKKNADFRELVAPILHKINDALARDGWYSYAPSAEEKEAINFLFARWSHKEEWLEKLTKKQREGILAEALDDVTLKELYDPLNRQLASVGFFDRDIALMKRYERRFGDEEERTYQGMQKEQVAVVEQGPAGLKTSIRSRWAPTITTDPAFFERSPSRLVEKGGPVRLTDRLTLAIQYLNSLQTISDLMGKFRTTVDNSKSTVQDIAEAEAAMIEALEQMGAWKVLSKKDGTGTIKLPDPGDIRAALEKEKAALVRLEQEHGRRRTHVDDPAVLGGDKGKVPKEFAEGKAKIGAAINELNQMLRAIPHAKGVSMRPITYRKLGTRLKEGLVKKADVRTNAQVLALTRIYSAVQDQLSLPLPPTRVFGKPKYKGAVAQEEAPAPEDIQLVADQLGLGLNLDITAASGNMGEPTNAEREAMYLLRDTLERNHDGVELGRLLEGISRELGSDHPYTPLIALLTKFPAHAAVNVRYIDWLPGKGNNVGRLAMDKGSPHILLKRDWFNQDGRNAVEALHVLFHEAVHAATVSALAGPYANPAVIASMRLLQKVAREYFGDNFKYATSDIFEFVAEAYTNIEFQRALKSARINKIKNRTLWERFVNAVRTFLNGDPPINNLLDAVMTLTTRTFSPRPLNFATQRAVDREVAELSDASLNMNADVFLERHFGPVRDALQDRAKLRKSIIDNAVSKAETTGFKWGEFVLKSLTMRQILSFYKDHFGYKDSHGEYKNPLLKYIDTFFARNAEAAHELEKADRFSRDWTVLESTMSGDAASMSEIMVDGTITGIHPDAPFPSDALLADKLAIKGLKGKEKKEAQEKFNAKYKDQPNRHLVEKQRADWKSLNDQFNKLSPEAQKLYANVREYYRKSIKREGQLLLMNALRASNLWDETKFGHLTANDLDLAELSKREGIEKFLKLDTSGDQHRINVLEEALSREIGALSKTQVRERKGEISRLTEALDAEKKQLGIIARMAALPTMRDGPYFPLRRFGDFVVRAERVVETKVFDDRAAMNEWVQNRSLDDATLQFNYPPTEDGHIVTVKEVEFRTAETITQANEEKRKLVEIYGAKAVSDVDRKADLFSDKGAAISDNSALQTLLGKLKDNAAAQNAIKAFYLQSLSDRSFRKGELGRKNIRGVQKDLQHRTFGHYSKSSSYYTAQLQHGHVMATAKQEMKKFLAERRGDVDVTTLRLRQVVEEIEKRDALAADIHDLPTFVRKSVEFGQFMLLTSPSYWLINATQPYMVTLPWLAGHSSVLEAAAALKNAQKLIISPLLKEAGKSYGGVKALWDRAAAERAFSVLEQVEDQISKSGHPHARELVEMLGKLKQEGIIDLSFIAELRQVAAGEDKGKWDAVMDASRIMAHLTEVNNRIMTAIAAYEVASKTRKSEIDRIEFAKRAVAETQFDYSAANKSRLFSGNDAAWKPLVFQFMQYTQHMYVLMFQQFNIMVKSGGLERKQAARILGGLLATHLAAGGLVGMTIQPIKWAFGLLAMAFGDDDEDNTFRNAVSGETYDRFLADMLAGVFGANKFSEVLRAGAPRMAGFDLSARMALGQLYMADINPKTAETLAGSIATSFFGPMVGLAGNMYTGVQRLAEGDLDRAAEMMSPKGVRDVIRAFRYADEGVTDNNGKIIMSPNKLGPVDLFWQSMGFAPSQVSELYSRNSAVKDRQMFAESRKAAVMRMQRMVRTTGERGEALTAMREYNRQFPDNPIKFSDVLRSIRDRDEEEQEIQRSGAALSDRERRMAREGDAYNVE